MSAETPSLRTPRSRTFVKATAVLAASFFIAPLAHALKGDANGDGQVTAQDAYLVADYLVGNILSVPSPTDADVNGDGRISTADSLLILQFSKGLRTSFDFQAPFVLTVLPANSSTGTLLSTNISIFFSEPVSASSLNGALAVTDTGSGLPVSGRIEQAQNGVIAAFLPDQPLIPLRTYRVDVSTAVTDEEANHLQQSFTSTFQTQPQGTGILVSTNNLAAPINELAPQPVVFKAVNSAGAPVKQVPVTFTARMGSGFFEPSKKRQVTVLTDDTGVAQIPFRLGGEAVLHTVEITAVGFSTVPKYTALALPLPAVNLRIYSGNSQNGAPGSTTPFPLIVQATDAGGNSVAGSTIIFTVTQGAGSFAGQPTGSAVTDSSGTAATTFTFGSTSGTVLVQASFPGMVGQAPVFNLLDLIPNPSSPTAIVGRVIDAGTLKPISHIYVYLVDNPTNWDWTDENGTFRLLASPGSHVVSVNGFESGPIGGKQYPVIAIPVNAVEGQENDIGMPALLPELDPLSYLDVSDIQGGTLTLRSDPRWTLYVAPGQARFANGTGTGRLFVASVPPDRIPMPVAGGKTSRFFDTVQPLNVVFDPPAQVSFPNTDSLPAGTVTEIFTLSYTSGTFVRTGRGQVSEDGQLVRSLPGEGITQGGWHNAPSPEPPPTTCFDGSFSMLEANQCTATAAGVSTTMQVVKKGRRLFKYRLCNIPANQPTSPVIQCTLRDPGGEDSDGDGWPDDQDSPGGPDGPDDPDPDDPDKGPRLELVAVPAENQSATTLYVPVGEKRNIFVAVRNIDTGEFVPGKFLDISDDSPNIEVPPSARTQSAIAVPVGVLGLGLAGAVVIALHNTDTRALARAIASVLEFTAAGYEADNSVLTALVNAAHPLHAPVAAFFNSNTGAIQYSPTAYLELISGLGAEEVAHVDAELLRFNVTPAPPILPGEAALAQVQIAGAIVSFNVFFNTLPAIGGNDRLIMASAMSHRRILLTNDHAVLRLSDSGFIPLKTQEIGIRRPDFRTGR